MKPVTNISTILVVDDDEGTLTLLEETLLAEKWSVATAASGAEALAWLQLNSADLLLLDFKLGDIESREFLTKLAEEGRSVPFIVITGHGDEDLAVEMMKRGALDYLRKDVNFINFVPTVVRRGLAQVERERRIAEVEGFLREEREFVSAVLQTAGALVVVLDESGRIIRFNLACEKVTGYSAKEIEGKVIWDWLLPPEEVAAVQVVFEQLLDGRLPSSYENHWLTKAGERRLIAWANTLLTRPEKHVIGTGLDITERKREERRRELQYAISRLLANSPSLAETVPKWLQIIAEAFEWEIGEFWEFSEAPKRMRMLHLWQAPKEELTAFVKQSEAFDFHSAGVPGRVLETGKPQWIPDIAECSYFARKEAAAQAGLRSALAFSIQLENQTRGVIVFLTQRLTKPDDDLLRMFTSLGSQLAQFMERKELEGQILEVSEREQRKFGHDMHDGLGQRLTGLEMMSYALAADLKASSPAAAKQAQRLNRQLRKTVTEARLISHSLAPVPLEGRGLMLGLTELAASTSRTTRVKCRVTCDQPVFIEDPTMATNLYRIAQEAVNNALKHGQAKQIQITLAEAGGSVEMAIENNGHPFPTGNPQKRGLGLNVMRYRAEMIGASLSIESVKPQGARVICTLPKKL